jgi:signal transduction histidine kinase
MPNEYRKPGEIAAKASRRPAGRRLDPVEAFEIIPWRVLALFRFATLAYAVALTTYNAPLYSYRSAAWTVLLVMVVWSGLATIGYERPRLRAWPLLLVDLVVAVACLAASRLVVGEHLLAGGMPTLTVTWVACPVLAVAVVKGVRWGIAAAALTGGGELIVRGVANQTTSSDVIIMIMAAAAVGYLGNIGTRAQERLREVSALDAARAERDRLARDIHDSVLQILALVQRQGEQLGGDAAVLGRLAGEQEVALRALVGTPTAAPAGMADLRELVRSLSSARVSISAPAVNESSGNHRSLVTRAGGPRALRGCDRGY